MLLPNICRVRQQSKKIGQSLHLCSLLPSTCSSVTWQTQSFADRYLLLRDPLGSSWISTGSIAEGNAFLWLGKTQWEGLVPISGCIGWFHGGTAWIPHQLGQKQGYRCRIRRCLHPLEGRLRFQVKGCSDQHNFSGGGLDCTIRGLRDSWSVKKVGAW